MLHISPAYYKKNIPESEFIRLSTNDRDNIKEGFVKNYLSNVTKLSKWQLPKYKIPDHDADHQSKNLRIMSWNVRYFTDIRDQQSMTKIIDTIKIINPDIICLNEMTQGMNQYYNDVISIDEKLTDYKLISSCNTTPAWFSAIYGNTILIRNKTHDNLCRADFSRQINIIDNNSKCFFNQYSRTYQEPYPEKMIIDNTIINNIGTSESRCFIKISLYDFDIFCTHLEAYEKDIRRSQFEELMRHVTRKSIIVGDLNMINLESYLEKDPNYRGDINNNIEWDVISQKNDITDIPEIEELKQLKNKYNLKDSFEISKKPYYGFTTWTNTIVDYILFTHEWDTQQTPIYPYIYFTDASDHCPICVDIELSYLQIINVPPMLYGLPFNTFIEEYIGYSSLFYHVTPLAAYNFFDIDHINTQLYTFSDPYLTGNFSMLLGTNGIYVGTKPYIAIDFLERLIRRTQQRTYKSLNSKFEGKSDYIKNIGILYEFSINKNHKLNSDNDVLIFTGQKYDSDYDNRCNLVRSTHGMNGIYKMTKKEYDSTNGVHNVFILRSVSLILDTIECNTNDCGLNDLVMMFELALDYIHYLQSRSSKKYDLNKNGYNTKIDPNKIEYLNNPITNIDFPIYKLRELPQQKGGYHKMYIEHKNNYISLNI